LDMSSLQKNLQRAPYGVLGRHLRALGVLGLY
jgi:hypothetical protein